jgi:signal transduction histidine kinase
MPVADVSGRGAAAPSLRSRRTLVAGLRVAKDVGESWLEGVACAANEACAAALTDLDSVKAVADAIDETAVSLATSRWTIAPDVLDRALGDPRLAQVAPTRALQAHLSLITGATLARHASLWGSSPTGEFVCISASTSDDAELSRVKKLAKLALEANKTFVTGVRNWAIAVPVSRCDVPEAVLLLRLEDPSCREVADEMALRVARHMSIIFERWHLLERSEAREQTLLQAVEKRLTRLGYDLHDGPLQQVISLAEEVRLLRSDIEQLVVETSRPAVAQGFGSLTEQAGQLEQALRGVAQSLESTALWREPLETLLQRECEALERRTGIVVDSAVAGSLRDLTHSQRIALYRVVQEALTNVREHSGASRVSMRLMSEPDGVTLKIADNGRGFDVETKLPAAAARGRLGLVGIAERVRLLGGACNISSTPGHGTTLSVALARWGPMASRPVDEAGGVDSTPR